MVSRTLFVLLGVWLVSAEQDVRTTDIFVEDISKAAETIKEVGEHISKMLGLDTIPFSKDIIQIIQNQTKSFTDQAEQVQKQLEVELKQIAGSPIAQGFTELNKKLQETILSFREQIESSGVAQKATELQGKFQDGINSLIEESKKIAQSLEPQMTEAGKQLEALTKTVINDAVENLSQLKDKLHTATRHQNN